MEEMMENNMTDQAAPDLIYGFIEPDQGGNRWTFSEYSDSADAEYIRADLAAPSAPADGHICAFNRGKGGDCFVCGSIDAAMQAEQQAKDEYHMTHAAPAEVEWLVERLRDCHAECGDKHSIFADAADALTAERDMWRDQASANLKTGATCLEIKDAEIARLTTELAQSRAETAAVYERAAEAICSTEVFEHDDDWGKAVTRIRALATEAGTTALAEIVKKAVDAETRACAEVAIRVGPVLSDSPYLDGMQACASQARAAILARIDQRKGEGK